MEIDVAEIDVAVAGLAETGFARESRPAEAGFLLAGFLPAGSLAAEIPAGAGRVRRRAVVPFDARVPTVISTMPSGTAR